MQRKTCALLTKAFHDIHTHSFYSNPNPITNPNTKPNPNPKPNLYPNPIPNPNPNLEIHTLSKQSDYLSK